MSRTRPRCERICRETLRVTRSVSQRHHPPNIFKESGGQDTADWRLNGLSATFALSERHLAKVGRASDVKSIEVAPEVLVNYVGVYGGTDRLGRAIRFEFFRTGRELAVSRDGLAKQTLTPVSNVKFVTAGGGQLEFVEENGEIVALQLYGIAGDPPAGTGSEGEVKYDEEL